MSYLPDNLEGVPDNLEGVPDNLDGVPGLGGLACCGTRLASEVGFSSFPAPLVCCFLLAAIMARSPELAAAGRLLAATFFPGFLVFFFTLLLGTASVDKSGHKKNLCSVCFFFVNNINMRQFNDRLVFLPLGVSDLSSRGFFERLKVPHPWYTASLHKLA